MFARQNQGRAAARNLATTRRGLCPNYGTNDGLAINAGIVAIRVLSSSHQ